MRSSVHSSENSSIIFLGKRLCLPLDSLKERTTCYMYTSTPIRLFSHVGRFHGPRTCHLYYVEPKPSKYICLFFSYSCGHFKIWVKSHTSRNIHMRHCSTWSCSLKILLIATLSLKFRRCLQYSHYSLFVHASVTFFIF
jgi:hypothetical protein